MNLLASGGVGDGAVRTEEARRILSRLARGSDPDVRIKAIESLAKIDREEHAAHNQVGSGDPRESALALLKSCGVYAVPIITEAAAYKASTV
jgi:hypothetical protein